jgi:hypothetical protein
MARSDQGDYGRPRIYRGEVWTDARGYATAVLPSSIEGLRGQLDYELTPSTPGVTAEIAAELMDGRFTIATSEPHVKVVWKVTARSVTRREE